MTCNCKNILNLQPICNPTINVSENCKPSLNIGDNIQGTLYHERLVHRDLPDQHPISAITGLEEALLNADKTFVFEQGSASDTWNITHNLDKYPSVTVVDSAGNEVIAEVTYTDTNKCVVKMTAAFKGKAYLN